MLLFRETKKIKTFKMAGWLHLRKKKLNKKVIFRYLTRTAVLNYYTMFYLSRFYGCFSELQTNFLHHSRVRRGEYLCLHCIIYKNLKLNLYVTGRFQRNVPINVGDCVHKAADIFITLQLMF